MDETDKQDEDVIDFSDIVPKEIELSMESLGEGDTNSKFAVLMVLVQAEEQLNEQDIVEKNGVKSDNIDGILDDLQTGGLVSRKVGERIGDSSTGGYVITTYGERILDGLYMASQPKFTDMVGHVRDD